MAMSREKVVPAALSVLVHVVIGVVFVASLEISPRFNKQSKLEVDIIEAVAVDESKVQYELDKIKKAEQRKRDEEARRQRALEAEANKAKEQRKTEEQRLADLKQKKEQEKQRLAELEKKKKVDTERAAKEQAAEQERLTKLQKEREALELKKKEEQKKVDELALKRKMEEEQAKEKQRAEDARKKKEREQAEQDKQARVAISSFEAQIKAKVESVWIKPTTFAPGSSCTVAVKLIPTGDVVDSRLSNCTGDDIFVRSVEAAIQKASPLPVPKDPAVFDRMRDINFVFKPQ